MPVYTVACKRCGTTFTRRGPKSHPPKYCSRKCSGQDHPPKTRPPSERVTVHCLQCGKALLVLPNRLASGRGRFCSPSCRSKHTSANTPRRPRTPEHNRKLGLAHIGKTPPNKGPQVPITCAICGKAFEVPQRSAKTARYCSRECSHEAKRRVTGTNHPLWTREQRVCQWCGETVWVKVAKLHEFRFCSRRCQGAYTSAKMAEQKGPTSIERLLMEELDRRGVAYKAQHQIAHWLVDIALPEYRIAIEADGNYWHNNDEQKAKDANKDHWLRAHKWAVFRFTETEIHQSPSACIGLVLKSALSGQLPLLKF